MRLPAMAHGPWGQGPPDLRTNHHKRDLRPAFPRHPLARAPRLALPSDATLSSIGVKSHAPLIRLHSIPVPLFPGGDLPHS
nr:hypothetical protein CFP56_58830 [Quercus suber]